MIPICVNLPDDLARKLYVLAKRHGLTGSEAVAYCITIALAADELHDEQNEKAPL